MKKTYWISLLILTTIILSACAPATPLATAVDESAQPEITTANPAPQTEKTNNTLSNEEYDGSGQYQPNNANQDCQHAAEMEAQLDANQINELDETEIEGLLFMREEEKLARDVYLTLYDQWGLRPFSNIASSEQTHTDSIKTLLEMYNIDDPVTDDTIGVFMNADLQALYNDLIDKGNTSLVDAIEVGAAIEEIDILDLIDYINNTDEANLEWVYQNLLAGSENHLRAFVRQYEMQTGEAYTPQYMSQTAYDAIISASQGGGGGHGGRHGNNDGGRGNGGGGGRWNNN